MPSGPPVPGAACLVRASARGPADRQVFPGRRARPVGCQGSAVAQVPQASAKNRLGGMPTVRVTIAVNALALA